MACFGVSESPQGVHERHRPVVKKMEGGRKIICNYIRPFLPSPLAIIAAPSKRSVFYTAQ